MRSKDIFLEIDLCKKIKELGVHQETSFFWIRPDFRKKHVLGSIFQSEENGSIVLKEKKGVFYQGNDEYAAWTAEELINLLPKTIIFENFDNAPLFIEKCDWIGHTDACRCYYLSHSFGSRATNSSWHIDKAKITATILLESCGPTLVNALAKLYIILFEKGIKKAVI
jgi:hypothetical protein